MNIVRLNEIEREIEKLEKIDIDHPRIEELNAEADSIIDEVNALEERKQAEAKRRNEEIQTALEAKRKEIKDLYDAKNYNGLFEKYGYEFVGNYEIDDDGGVTSYAGNEPRIWKSDEIPDNDAKKKVRTLVGHRIYNHYFRNKNPY